MHQRNVLLAASLAVAPLAAQLPTGLTVVATRLNAPGPLTRLLAIDGSGTLIPIGRFPSDVFPPLAVEIDPIDRHLLVAVDLGGTSLIVRLVPQGAAIAVERQVSILNVPVTQLHVVGDMLFASAGGPNGGLFRLPRRGGAATLVAARADLDAMFVFGQQALGILAWTGTAAAPGGIAYTDFTTGQPYYGPFAFGAALPAVTGIVDLPTGLPQQILSFADGTIAVFSGFLGPPQTIPLAPQPPPGGIAAMKAPGPSFFMTGVGGAAFPFLFDVDPTAGTVTPRTAALPGNPVDFALPAGAAAQTLPFAAPCGTPPLAITDANGPPQLGNALYRVELAGGAPGQAAVLVAGFADTSALGAPLPFPLPGGCALHVEPAAVLFHLTSGAGAASQAMAVPAAAVFAGTIVFAQWLQAPGAGFIGSGALAIQIAP
jgi:hypothetical protein